MKKILSVLLAIALLATLSTVAFATDITAVPGSDTKDVNVIVDGLDDIETVYKVVIDWDSLDFTYTFGEDDTWDPDTHTYGNDDATTGWDKTSASIQVTNHSNAAVDVAASIDNATLNGVTASLAGNTFSLATAVGTEVAAAPTNTATVSVAGVPTVENNFTIGTVTVDITAA